MNQINKHMVTTQLTPFETEIIWMALEDLINNPDFDRFSPQAQAKIDKLLTKFENITENPIEKW